MQADAADQRQTLERALRLQPGLERALLRELELLALDLAPGLNLEELPSTVEEYLEAGDLAGRVWRQYLLRVSRLAQRSSLQAGRSLRDGPRLGK
ncbi:MAG: hypothetical protein WKF31_09770 [Thermoleophilaceae bacterium]